jgi:hypothetical protein
LSKSIGYVQMAVTTAVAFDITSLTGNESIELAYALIQPETNGLRIRDDGTNPTASVGFPVAAGGSLTYDDPGAIISGAAKIVSQTGTSTVNVWYFAT